MYSTNSVTFSLMKGSAGSVLNLEDSLFYPSKIGHREQTNANKRVWCRSRLWCPHPRVRLREDIVGEGVEASAGIYYHTVVEGRVDQKGKGV